jgi:steroid delta-isomerase-like uncharacterized protein
MSDSIKEIVNRKFTALIPTWDLALVDEIFDENIVSHDPTEPEPIRGRETYRAAMHEFGSAFPRAQINIEDQLTAGDRVVTRWSFTSRHDREVYGVPATGRQVTITGMDIHRVADGRIVEEWTEWDALGLMRQLGLISE